MNVYQISEDLMTELLDVLKATYVQCQTGRGLTYVMAFREQRPLKPNEVLMDDEFQALAERVFTLEGRLVSDGLLHAIPVCEKCGNRAGSNFDCQACEDWSTSHVGN